MITCKKILDINMIGKRFLLSSLNRKFLFIDKRQNRYEIYLHRTGNISVNIISESGERTSAPELTSLVQISEKLLSTSASSAKQPYRYLILPEIEIERIFNSLRWKYLAAIVKANKIYKPCEYITSECNYLFNALVHRPIRGTKKQNLKRKWKTIYREQGMPIDSFINYLKEKASLEFIIHYLLRNFKKNDVYQELISIKPGFHEVFMDKIHGFEHSKSIQGNDKRAKILMMIHKKIKGPVKKIRISNIRSEINADKFLGYAPCNITEGPFVYRNSHNVLYFQRLKRLPRRASILDFNKYFLILDYKTCIATKKDLKEILSKARMYLEYPNLI